jgi:hypothetical protein
VAPGEQLFFASKFKAYEVVVASALIMKKRYENEVCFSFLS